MFLSLYCWSVVHHSPSLLEQNVKIILFSRYTIYTFMSHSVVHALWPGLSVSAFPHCYPSEISCNTTSSVGPPLLSPHWEEQFFSPDFASALLHLYYGTLFFAAFSKVCSEECLSLGSIHIKKCSLVTYCGMNWHSWLTLVYAGFWEDLQ